VTSEIQAALESLLGEGRNRIGEILITCTEAGKFVLLHHADSGNHDSLLPFSKPDYARELSKYDAAGEYRPLKSAPNLRRGWVLHLQTLAELREALDFFYPAMLGVWLAYQRGRLEPVNFRETSSRQSGMYDVVKKISNEQADELAGEFCKSDGNCLKTILWKIDRDTPLTKLPADKFDPQADQLRQTVGGGKSMPLLCAEACNLLVAAARSVVHKPRNAK